MDCQLRGCVLGFDTTQPSPVVEAAIRMVAEAPIGDCLAFLGLLRVLCFQRVGHLGGSLYDNAREFSGEEHGSLIRP